MTHLQVKLQQVMWWSASPGWLSGYLCILPKINRNESKFTGTYIFKRVVESKNRRSRYMHLLIERNPCTKFGIDQVKGSKDIDRTRLGLQTDGHTDRPTVAKQYALFSRGA